jgi:hypothetical protein
VAYGINSKYQTKELFCYSVLGLAAAPNGDIASA